MSVDVVCPGNNDVVLQAVAGHDSTFNVKCPFNFAQIEDWSYGCSIDWAPVAEPNYKKYYDKDGQFIYQEIDTETPTTGRQILSAIGYKYHFPYKLSGTQNNSVGWFNSWGMNSGDIGYTLGNIWKFRVVSAFEYDNTSKFKQVSGKCGLNMEDELFYFAHKNNGQGTMNDDTRIFIIRNNNAIFDYYLQGANHQYLKLGLSQTKNDELNINNDADKDESNYWIQTYQAPVYPDVIKVPSYYLEEGMYGKPTGELAKEKNAQALAGGIPDGEYPYIDKGQQIFLTPTQIENFFDIDMNEPKTYQSKKYKKGTVINDKGHLRWRIYGVYWYNGVKKYMECDDDLQEKFDAMMTGMSLKANFNSFRLLITYVTQLRSDIIYENIDYANIVIEITDDQLKRITIANGGDKHRYVVADTMYVKMEPNYVYLPGAVSMSYGANHGCLSAGMEVTLSTPPTVIKPNFLINKRGFVDFPCYKYFGDTINTIETNSFSYDSKSNKTSFNIVLDGLVPADIEINADGDDWRVLNRRTVYYVPQPFDLLSKDYEDDYTNHKRDIIDGYNVFDVYPYSKNTPSGCQSGLYLQPSATLNGSPFGCYTTDGGLPFRGVRMGSVLTLGSRYPMTPNAAVRFIRKMIITVEVDGDHILKSFDLTSESSAQTKTLDVKYNGLAAQTKVEKLDNTIPRSMNGVTLQPYMYDATKLKVNYKLTGGEEISLTNSDITLTISDNTGAGKGLTDIKLSDIVNRDYDDFIYCTGLAKNEADGCYEITIYMAAKASDSTFNGKGFNDSTVMVRFNINEYYKKAFSLMDVDYNVVYITTLPPYLIQGIPFTRSPADEKVLNSNIAPENSAARVDFLYDSYADNNFGYKEDAMFSNSNPLYVCIASAFVPNNFNGTISGVNCTMYDTVTKARYPIAWESANNGANQYVVLTSADNSTYKSSNTEYSAMANIQLWTFEQTLDIPSVRARHGVASNIVEISAHLDYTSINEELEQQNMVTIRSTT